MCLIFHFYWSYPQTSASYVYDFGSWWWCLTALNCLYLFHDLKHYPLFTWSILLLAAHFAPSSHFFIYIRCLFAVFSPCFCLLQVGPNICISVYWCSSKMLFHRRIFFLTETSEILALVQYRLTWPKTHSSIQVRAARFYLSIQRNPAIAHFKGPGDFMPYSRNALLPSAIIHKRTKPYNVIKIIVNWQSKGR